MQNPFETLASEDWLGFDQEAGGTYFPELLPLVEHAAELFGQVGRETATAREARTSPPIGPYTECIEAVKKLGNRLFVEIGMTAADLRGELVLENEYTEAETGMVKYADELTAPFGMSFIEAYALSGEHEEHEPYSLPSRVMGHIREIQSLTGNDVPRILMDPAIEEQVLEYMETAKDDDPEPELFEITIRLAIGIIAAELTYKALNSELQKLLDKRRGISPGQERGT